MTVIVHYVDFHWDNYQGGSGKSFELSAKFDIPNDLPASGVEKYILAQMDQRLALERPFRQNSAATIKRIEIV